MCDDDDGEAWSCHCDTAFRPQLRGRFVHHFRINFATSDIDKVEEGLTKLFEEHDVSGNGALDMAEFGHFMEELFERRVAEKEGECVVF